MDGKLLNRGYTSDAWLCGEKNVLLVGRYEGAYGEYVKAAENAALLRGRIQCVKFPEFDVLIPPCEEFPFGAAGYPFVPGTPMKPEKLTMAERDEVARSLAVFCAQLHGIRQPCNREAIIRYETTEIGRNLCAMESYLSANECRLLEKWYDRLIAHMKDAGFCLTHGDLWAENLLLDEENRLCGILDFSAARFLPPEVDYAAAWNLADGFLNEMLRVTSERIDRDSVMMYAVRREVSSFEMICENEPEDIPEQLQKLRTVMRAL